MKKTTSIRKAKKLGHYHVVVYKNTDEEVECQVRQFSARSRATNFVRHALTGGFAVQHVYFANFGFSHEYSFPVTVLPSGKCVVGRREQTDRAMEVYKFEGRSWYVDRDMRDELHYVRMGKCMSEAAHCLRLGWSGDDAVKREAMRKAAPHIMAAYNRSGWVHVKHAEPLIAHDESLTPYDMLIDLVEQAVQTPSTADVYYVVQIYGYVASQLGGPHLEFSDEHTREEVGPLTPVSFFPQHPSGVQEEN